MADLRGTYLETCRHLIFFAGACFFIELPVASLLYLLSRFMTDLTIRSPGRWLASHLLKLMLAYVVLNYDIQPIDERPAEMMLGDFIVPSRNTMIKVRRRELIQ